MHKHSTWGVLSQGRNSKELTVRETHSGTLGFNGRQRPKPYQYLYVYFYLVNYFLGLARWGGDEFTILLTQILNINDAGKIAQRIIDALKLPFYLENQEIHTSTSVGIAVYPDDGEDVDTLLKKADSALYEAKKNGRNNYQYYMAKNLPPIHLEAMIQPNL